MKHRPSAHEITKLTEAIDKLLGPRRLIVGLPESKYQENLNDL